MNKLCLTRELFDDLTVANAIFAFKSLADINYCITDSSIEVFVSSSKCPRDILLREFENYCIDLLNKEKKW